MCPTSVTVYDNGLKDQVARNVRMREEIICELVLRSQADSHRRRDAMMVSIPATLGASIE